MGNGNGILPYKDCCFFCYNNSDVSIGFLGVTSAALSEPEKMEARRDDYFAHLAEQIKKINYCVHSSPKATNSTTFSQVCLTCNLYFSDINKTSVYMEHSDLPQAAAMEVEAKWSTFLSSLTAGADRVIHGL